MRKPYISQVLEIVRKHNSYGFVKESDANEIEKIIEQHIKECILVEREIAYNEGFVSGVRSVQGMAGAN